MSVQMTLSPRFWQCQPGAEKTGGGHERCQVAALSSSGSVHLCGCECHGNRCDRCGEPEAGHVPTGPACQAAIARLATTNESIREARLARSMEIGVGKTGRARAARAAASRGMEVGTYVSPTCAHCGAPTKGGLFQAGHDAKLKGELITAARAGDIEALAEYLWRNWDKGNGVKGCSPDQHVKAKEIAEHQEVATWLANRVKARSERHKEAT